jgi:DNA transformation protein and related proteins
VRRSDPFVEECLELLRVVGPVRARAMFGGHGIYSGDRMFALIADGRLYLKVDDRSRDAFERVGSTPFQWQAKDGKRITMSYWELPAEGWEDPDETRRWASLALHAAERARKGPGKGPGKGQEA